LVNVLMAVHMVGRAPDSGFEGIALAFDLVPDKAPI
jgi:hypothetical protein